MIKLTVDECYAFDFLSILAVKNKKTGHGKNQFDFCSQNIRDQVDNFDDVISSSQYQSLVDINEKIFNAVDLAKQNLVTAKLVDDLNYDRYLVKQQLQKRFYDTLTNEKKHGYDR